MKNMIDLTPYLSPELVMEQRKRPRRLFDLASVVESIVTVLLGIAILFGMACFMSAF